MGCVGETKIIRKDSQDLVKSLIAAGIDVNIASSAGISEATDIAKRLNLMSAEVHMKTFYLKDKDIAQTLENILNQLFREMKAGQMMEMDLIHKESEGAKRSRGIHKWIASTKVDEEDRRFGSFDITHLGFDIVTERTLVLSGKALSKIARNSSLVQQFRMALFLIRRVIGFDFNPSEKAILVKMLKQDYHTKVAALGVGYHDLQMIAESDVGIQLKLSTFKVDYGDLIIGDLGILKKLIFSYSKQLLRNNISVLLMVTKFNLLFGYLIWMHQFILGNVYANMFNSGHYIILNLLLLFIFIDRSMFRLVDDT